jgi:putative zinc finger protein
MQEYAPTTDASSPIGACPSAEALAAYIDGVLDKAEAERVTAHLADCEDCYFVYSETLRFQLDSPPEKEKDGDVVQFPQPHPRPRIDPVWYRIAALLVVGVGTGTYFYLFNTPPTLKTIEVAAPIPAQSRAVFDEKGIWTGPITRGVEAPEEVAEPAFRMGVQLVNLQVSLRAGKTVEAQNAMAAILNILQAGVLTEDLRGQYTKLTGSLEEGHPLPSTALAEAGRLSKEVRDVYPGDEISLDLGQWVEAGRLAAAAGNPVFFQEGETQSFLRRLLWRDRFGLGEVKLDAETRQNLEEVSGILSKGELAASDYGRLTKELGQILERHYPAHG